MASSFCIRCLKTSVHGYVKQNTVKIRKCLVIFPFSLLYAANKKNEKMTYQIEPLNHCVTPMGEGPHWDICTQSLYFVCIHTARLFRYDYNEDKTYDTRIENVNFATFIIPIKDKPNQFAVGLDRRVGIIEWDGKSSESKLVSTLFEVESNNEKLQENRFNDAKADPRGRFYGGTMPIKLDGTPINSEVLSSNKIGNLYRYDTNSKVPILIKDNVRISNGLTWNIKTKKFYYIDSLDFDIKEYDYDIETGEIKNPKVLIDFHKKGVTPNFVPDGMTIDSNGNLYVAIFGGSKVLKINPNNGKIEMEIMLPAEQITSVAFGGPNLDILYVTTAASHHKPSPAGQTFKITGLGVKGLPMNKLKL